MTPALEARNAAIIARYRQCDGRGNRLFTQRQIGEEFGLHEETIRKIIARYAPQKITVTREHWDRGIAAFRMGGLLSTTCAVAQAIAERFPRQEIISGASFAYVGWTFWWLDDATKIVTEFDKHAQGRPYEMPKLPATVTIRYANYERNLLNLL